MVGNLPAVEILTWYLAWDLGAKKMSGTRAQDGGWEPVGRGVFRH